MSNKAHGKHIVDQNSLPEKFPTHAHDAAFWESLGRTIATFGFLEEVLSKAIFAFTATRPYEEHEIQQAYLDWLPKLEHALTDQLGSLIDTYGKSVRDNPHATIEDLDSLINELREASRIRNVLCHGSWGKPNANGASVPFFVNRKLEIFDTAVDCQFLNQVQASVAKLACLVISTVTHMGYQFPGSSGPGKPICDISNDDNQKLPNKACSRLVGFCRIFNHFSGFGFFLLSKRIPARPPAANANR